MSDRESVLVRHWPPLALLAALAVITGAFGGSGASVQTMVAQALIMVTFAVGIATFVANSGVISFAHAGFMALGAYLGGILSMPTAMKGLLLPGLPGVLSNVSIGDPLATAIAAVAVGAIAYVVAIPLSRLDGLPAGVASVALLLIVNNVLSNTPSMFGTSGTVTGIPITTTTWVAYGGAAVAIVLAWVYWCSPSGMRLRSSREDLPAARSLGIDVERERRRAFALSAAIGAIAGSLNAHLVGSLTPSDYYVDITFLALSMLVVGGLYSLSGAVIGAIIVSLINDCFTKLQNGTLFGLHVGFPDGVANAIIAALVFVILIARPAGLTGGMELVAPAFLRRRREAESDPEPLRSERVSSR